MEIAGNNEKILMKFLMIIIKIQKLKEEEFLLLLLNMAHNYILLYLNEKSKWK